MKTTLYRFDASFDQPGQHVYTAVLTPSNLEGMKALKNITLQNYRGTSIKLGGYSTLTNTQRTAAEGVLRILIGTRFATIGYNPTTKGFHLYFKANKDEILGIYIDRITCVTTKLLPRVQSLPSYDDSDLGREQGYVVYSERVPNWGHYIGYKLPFSMTAYQKRINKETSADKTIADTKTHVAEETVKQEQAETLIQNENLSQTKAKFSRWAIIGTVAATVAIIVAVIVYVARKK